MVQSKGQGEVTDAQALIRQPGLAAQGPLPGGLSLFEALVAAPGPRIDDPALPELLGGLLASPAAISFRWVCKRLFGSQDGKDVLS